MKTEIMSKIMLTKLCNIVSSSEELIVKIASSRPINPKIASDLIMWYQNNDYSHVLVILNDMVFQATHLGVNVIPLEEFLKDHVIVNSIEVQKEKCDFEFLFNFLGRTYGFIQIFEIAWKYIIMTKLKLIGMFKYKDNGNQYLICSEYVGKFLKLPWVNDLTDPKEVITYLLSIRKYQFTLLKNFKIGL